MSGTRLFDPKAGQSAAKESDSLKVNATVGGDSKLRWEEVKNNIQTSTEDRKWSSSTNARSTTTLQPGRTW